MIPQEQYGPKFYRQICEEDITARTAHRDYSSVVIERLAKRGFRGLAIIPLVVDALETEMVDLCGRETLQNDPKKFWEGVAENMHMEVDGALEAIMEDPPPMPERK